MNIDQYGNRLNSNDNFCYQPSISPKEQQKERKNCCCKKSMIAALKLLCNTELSNLIDFEKFAFLSNSFIVGARLVLLKVGSEEKDNLSNLDGTFKRFSPSNCDLIDIGGTVSYDFPLPVSLSDLAEQLRELIQNIVDILGEQSGILGTLVSILRELLKIFDPQDFNEELLEAIFDFLVKYFTTLPVVDTASLCGIESIAFQVKRADISDTDNREELTEANYQRAKKLLQGQLDKTNKDCAECKCNCECDDCCCTDSILSELFSSNLSRKVTLTAGNLTLRDATILGVKGDVLVLANDKRKRFYFVCASQVQFLE